MGSKLLSGSIFPTSLGILPFDDFDEKNILNQAVVFLLERIDLLNM